MRRISNGRSNKAILTIVAFIFVLSNFYFFIFNTPKKADAQVSVVLDPTQAAIQIPWKGLEIAQISTDEILNDLKATFFKNVVATLARNFAKSFASYIVTGGKGGSPFWETNIWDSIKNQGQAAFEDWVTAAVSKGIGLDLCKFDPTLTLNIALTLPNKTDNILGARGAGGCSFQDLKDKFSNDSPEWQDYIKIKATEIGPNFNQTINQLKTDIDRNRNLRLNNADAPTWESPESDTLVLGDLSDQANILEILRARLDDDITEMLNKRGTNTPAQLTIGEEVRQDYSVAPENIGIIKTAWIKKIGAGRSYVNTKKAAYQACLKKNIESIRITPCDEALNQLGYNPVPGQTWVDAHIQDGKAQYFLREATEKMQTAYNLYNSLANGYETLYKFTSDQIKSSMFETGGLYTLSKAQTQFDPKADQAAETSKQVKAGSDTAKTEAENRQKTEVSTTGGWKNKVDTISKYIVTPAELLKARSIEAVAADSSSTVLDYTKSIVADSLGIFLRELYNLYINQLLMALSNPKKQKAAEGNNFNPQKQSIVTQEGVNLYYDSLGQEASVTLPDLDLLQQFQTSIASKKVNPNIYNNVIDLNFAMAIDQRMSISDAIAKSKLKGDSTFSWSETLLPNTFNLSNIRKLRKARVVPLGLELAAELIRDCNYRKDYNPCTGLGFNACTIGSYITTYCFWDGPSSKCLMKDVEAATGVAMKDAAANFMDVINAADYKPTDAYSLQRFDNCIFGSDQAVNKRMYDQVIANVTLAKVIADFGVRGDDGICGTYDLNESPFCNLVDPNWVLKIPATKCLQPEKIESYGEVLQDNETGTRYSRCADFASCLTGDTRNKCASSSYGVCVKEKNVWTLGGDPCPAQYDSCRIYSTTSSRNKKDQVAFLKNTLDPSGCSPDNAGCKGYTRSYDNYTIYFNRNVKKCEASAEGCHEFITDPVTLDNYPDLPTAYDDNALATRVYYKINPACDLNPEGANCSSFMPKCLDSEVGCASYKPLSGAPAVTAVLHQDDQCSAECNGFSAYFRQPTSFELVSKLEFFVNRNTTTCSAESAGCAEFTNLEKINTGVPVAEALEYYTSLRQCIKPGSGLNEKTFFTWQSIASGPQQVIKHLLQADTDGSPKTINGSADCRGDITVGNYCLKFYDVSGNTFYRDIRKTIIVSDTACFPLRKTVSNEANCIGTNGSWDNTNNYCTYNAYVPTAEEAARAGFGEKSQTCAAADNGCFNYLAASGNNIYNVFYDDFNEGTSSEYDEAGVSISEESLIPSNDENEEDMQYSLSIYANAQAVRTVEIAGGKYYVLAFLAKGACAEGVTTVAGSLSVPGFGSVDLNCDWSAYELGPVMIDSNLNNLVISNQTTGTVYIDNVNLVQHKANYYLIENSWPQVACTIEDLNCEAYNGPNSQIFYIKQFPNLCAENKVGCQYLLDTQNSLSPVAENFSGVIVPADIKSAYVVSSDFKCTLEAKGCEKFREPSYQASTGVVYDDVILKNDPDAYAGVATILCAPEDDGCTELFNEGGYPEYYKINPAKICQHESSGWYLNGLDGKIPCNPDEVATILKLTDDGYVGNIGACPVSAGNCTGFQTINQQANLTANITKETCLENYNNAWIANECLQDYYGATYYIIDNEDQIDRTSCVGNTDWNKGCVAFKNTVSNDVQIIKVIKDRDCAEWVNCVEFDNVGNCTKMAAEYYDDLGVLQTPEITVPLVNSDSAEGLKDNVRYSTGGQPLIINRSSYIRRLSPPQDVNANGPAKDDDNLIWKNGDYSGYTIPDRYPLETELIKGFYTYPREIATATDTRFADPVCKSFPAQDSPISGEIVSKFGYSKISNVYSQTVGTAQVGDGCNYDTVEASGVTTYFPYGYLKILAGKDPAKICTGRSSVNGKFCQGQEKNNTQCKTISDDENASEQDQSNAFGKCQGIENITPNIGLQSRCLEMDLLNPLYGAIKSGAYACLSYFPFQYDECRAIQNSSATLAEKQVKCVKLPNCSWVGGDTCVSDICSSYGNKESCENDVFEAFENISKRDNSCKSDDEGNCLFLGCSLGTLAPGETAQCLLNGTVDTRCTSVNGICLFDECALGTLDGQIEECLYTKTTEPKCIWDGSARKCLFRRCSLSDVGTAAECKNLAKYCHWYGQRCVEDICTEPYAADLGGHNLKPTPDDPDDPVPPQVLSCNNLSDGTLQYAEPEDPKSSIFGKGDYCSWQKMVSDNNNIRWYCQLQCALKYPNVNPQEPAGESMIRGCNEDPFCKFEPANCQYVCDGINNPADCRNQPNAKCSWDRTTNACVSTCETLSTIGTVQKDATTSEDITDYWSNFKCNNACDNKTPAACTGDCGWNGSKCVSKCPLESTQADCEDVMTELYQDQRLCSWDGVCLKKDIYSCTSLNPITTQLNYDKCDVRPGCEVRCKTADCGEMSDYNIDLVDFDSSPCAADSDCRREEVNYKCVNACNGKTQDKCGAIDGTNPGNGACVWDASKGKCVNFCTTIDLKDQCLTYEETSNGTIQNVCEWTDGKCVKSDAPLLSCTLINPLNRDTINDDTLRINTEVDNVRKCLGRWGCEIDYPKCKKENTPCKEEGYLNNYSACISVPDCAWGKNECVEGLGEYYPGLPAVLFQ